MKCLDTYALVEVHNGNPKFAGFLTEEVVVPDIIMAEFYAHIYSKYDLKTADYWRRKLSFLCKPVSLDILLQAVRFRIDNKEKDFSFFDCVGYVFAIENNMKFVTGDGGFRQMKGVEFLK